MKAKIKGAIRWLVAILPFATSVEGKKTIMGIIGSILTFLAARLPGNEGLFSGVLGWVEAILGILGAFYLLIGLLDKWARSGQKPEVPDGTK